MQWQLKLLNTKYRQPTTNTDIVLVMKNTILIIIALLMVGGAYFGYQSLYPKPMPKPDQKTTDGTNPEQPIKYTLAQVAEHSTKDSCWMALEGSVYDVTPFVKSGFHPGKDAILQGCGRDATELFNTRPMGSKTPHSEKARKNLPKYLIGELTK